MDPETIEKVRHILKKKPSIAITTLRPMTKDRFVSTGSTCLNLACTGDPDNGFMKGGFYWFVGDSDSGKTFLTMTCFAEASIDPDFDDYRLIYDGPEGGALMDIQRFFGRRVAERLEPPVIDEDGTWRSSRTIQGFYFNLDTAFKLGRPFIWVLDSHDSLSSEEERSKFEERKKAHEKGKLDQVSGSYGDGKARYNSSNLRQLMEPLENTGSILIVISQTRDSFDMFSSGSVSGGRALKFYATQQLWSSQAGKIKKTVNGKERELGTLCKVRVKKSRTVGRDRTVVIPVYHSVGVDDIGGCIDYLLAEKVWKKGDSGKITVTGLGPEMKLDRERLVAVIEEQDMFPDLKALVKQTWDDIEEKCKITRKSRYE